MGLMGREKRLNGKLVVSAVIIIQFFRLNSEAAFLNSSPNVAAEGMGGAFVAKADNSASLFINPAGLSQIPRPEASFMYGRPLLGLPGINIQQAYLSLSHPVNNDWTWGAGVTHFDAAGLLQDQELVLGGAWKFHRMAIVGLNVDYLRHSVKSSDDPLASGDPVQGKTKGAVSADVGVMLKPHPLARLGFSARHINKPDVGLVSEDRVPMEWRAGGLFKKGPVRLTADLINRGASTGGAGRSVFALGGEWILDMQSSASGPELALRAGLNKDQMAAGFGVFWGNLAMDYAFAFSQDTGSDSSGTHRVSLSFRFGDKRNSSGKAVNGLIKKGGRVS